MIPLLQIADQRHLWTALLLLGMHYQNLSRRFSGSILASGGGTADRCIRIWNSSNGSLLNTVDTKSQVCSLVWAPEYKELVSAHGYANNEISIWKYPSMVSKGLSTNVLLTYHYCLGILE